MTALSTILEYERRPFSGLTQPWRHPSPVVRALYAKRVMRKWATALDDLGPGPDYRKDVAFDAMCDAADQHRSIITAAWQARHMERLADAPMTVERTSNTEMVAAE